MCIDSVELGIGVELVQRGWLEMNHSLCWLGLAKNRLRRLTHLQNLSSLAVLDFSDNKVARCNATTCQDMPEIVNSCCCIRMGRMGVG